jgi:hypothetical protein
VRMATLGEIAAVNATERDGSDERRRTQREAARQKKQRQRERQREAARIAAIAEAERMEREAERKERLDEELAPAVMRDAIYADAERTRMLIGPRVQVIDGKPVRGIGPMADPINTLDLRPHEKRAARLLQLDYRDVGTGLSVGAVDYLRSNGGGGDGLGGHEAMLAQIATRARFDGAMTFLGAFSPGVRRVVLDGVPVSFWAEEAGLTEINARAWIAAGLGRLSLFFFPPKPASEKADILTFGPARESYDTSMHDTGDSP